jgi:hypothetical protein
MNVRALLWNVFNCRGCFDNNRYSSNGMRYFWHPLGFYSYYLNSASIHHFHKRSTVVPIILRPELISIASYPQAGRVFSTEKFNYPLDQNLSHTHLETVLKKSGKASSLCYIRYFAQETSLDLMYEHIHIWYKSTVEMTQRREEKRRAAGIHWGRGEKKLKLSLAYSVLCRPPNIKFKLNSFRKFSTRIDMRLLPVLCMKNI